MSLIPDEIKEAPGQDSGQGQDEDSGDRPDFVEHQFWDADEGKIRVKEMARALADTQTKLRNQKDELRAEIEGELKKGRPEKPEDYELKDLDLPEDSGFEIPEDNKLIQGFRKWAYDVGLTNDQFNKAVSLYAQDLLSGIPDTKKEIEALGENAQERIGSLVRKAKQSLNDEEFQTFQDMAMTAKAFSVIEKLAAKTDSGPSSFDRVEPNAYDLGAQIDKIMKSEDYWRGDPEANRQVLEMNQRLAKMQGRA